MSSGILCDNVRIRVTRDVYDPFEKTSILQGTEGVLVSATYHDALLKKYRVHFEGRGRDWLLRRDEFEVISDPKP